MSQQRYEYAQRIMNIHTYNSQKSSDRAIFGSSSELTANLSRQFPYRIGLWPCIGLDQPSLAMGIWTLFAFLLDGYKNVQVYRNFIRFDSSDDLVESEAKMETQFTLDDWIFDELNENVAIWGEFHIESGQYQLTVYIESDLLSDSSDNLDDDAGGVSSLQLQGENLSQLIVNLVDLIPSVLANVVESKDISARGVLLPVLSTHYTISDDFLISLFKWELLTCHYLWDLNLDDDEILDTFTDITDKTNTESEAWCIGMALYRSTLPGLSLIGELLINEIKDEFPTDAINQSVMLALFRSNALMRLGRVGEALQLLESKRELQGDIESNTYYWLNLCHLMVRSGDLVSAIDAYQIAIENNITDPELMRQYAVILELADRYGIDVTTFILIDPDLVVSDRLLWESIAALNELDSDQEADLEALTMKLSILLVIDIPTFWDEFERLVAHDKQHDHISRAIELIEESDFIDISPGISVIENAIASEGSVLRKNLLRLDLIRLLILDHNIPDAKDILGLATKELNDQYTEDLVQLKLLVEIDNYTYEVSDIRSVLDAGNRISDRQVRILERAIGIAPRSVELNLLLSQSLNIDGKQDMALNVLLDAHQVIGNDIVLLTAIVSSLREYEDDQLTEEYIRLGLQNEVLHVPLLIQAAYFYIDKTEYDYARELLSQIERLASNSPELDQLRRYIAQNIQ